MDPNIDGDASRADEDLLTVFYWNEEVDEDAGAWWLDDDWEGPTEEP